MDEARGQPLHEQGTALARRDLTRVEWRLPRMGRLRCRLESGEDETLVVDEFLAQAYLESFGGPDPTLLGGRRVASAAFVVDEGARVSH
jgi:hypothetical protein